ncbi:hypothetical protein YPPY64_3993, partial [Yersinia pestis PY-64]
MAIVSPNWAPAATPRVAG